MRLKRSQALIFTISEGELVAYNFLTKSVFQCSLGILQLLQKLDNWLEVEAIRNLLPEYEPAELQEALDGLVSVSALIEENAPNAVLDKAYERDWTWGLPSALMHFSVQDSAYISLDEAEAMQREKSESSGLIDLYRLNGDAAIRLADPLGDKPLMGLMASRRTIRQARPEPITLEQLSDCLFSGLGITGSRSNSVAELPLSMTPSGGARNPFEAYIFAGAVTGLSAGIYHYSALQHTLEPVGKDGTFDLVRMIGGQEWAAGKPCLILLCAYLERTMWKYQDPNAYRVVMIEAGHIGQNIMLTATQNGLTACPTAAIDQSYAKSVLGLDGITRTPIYALTLSFPDSSEADRLKALATPPHS